MTASNITPPHRRKTNCKAGVRVRRARIGIVVKVPKKPTTRPEVESLIERARRLREESQIVVERSKSLRPDPKPKSPLKAA